MPSPPTRPDGGLTLILAHPDDESFFAAGTAALAAAEGRRVELIVASRGEAGSLPPGDSMPGSGLAAARTAELMTVADTIGLNNVHFLDLPDRGVADATDAPIGVVAALLRSHRPAVVFTFGADGFNRHPDHVAIHELAHAALRLATDPAAPVDGAPIRAPRMVETGSVEPWHQLDAAELAGRPEVDYLIDIRRAGMIKHKALSAHQTQRHLIAPRFFAAEDPLACCRYEVFRHGGGPAPDGAGPASSLFAGLR